MNFYTFRGIASHYSIEEFHMVIPRVIHDARVPALVPSAAQPAAVYPTSSPFELDLLSPPKLPFQTIERTKLFKLS